MTGPMELLYTSGEPVNFIDQLWLHLPADSGGVLVGALHLPAGRGQIVIQVSTSGVGELTVFTGQVLVVVDPADAATWCVVDGPAPLRLNLPPDVPTD